VKGAVDNFGAVATHKAALRLEQLARAGDLGNAPRASASLKASLARLEAELAAVLHEKARAEGAPDASQRRGTPW
jgi:hypothetical protein